MIAGVADTHAAVWYMFGDPRLSGPAKSAFDAAAASRRKIALSVISLAEAPVTSEIIGVIRDVLRANVPDMPDRIVAATAVYFGVPVISRDGQIRTSGVRTIW
jgi:PIN domain nuclease of toxin-antitoxin system